jgi:hypothetical protein
VNQDENPQATRKVTLEPLVSYCAAGECPTIYRTDRGTLVLQGYTFEPSSAGTEIPAGERMIEVPVELLAEYVRRAG